MSYPVIWNLVGKKILVVGGGEVAVTKIGSLLEAGAHITVISPELHEDVRGLAAAGKLDIVRRGYESGDADETLSLIIAATNERNVNAQVVQDAKAGRIPVCAVDDPENSDFIVPSVLKRGRLLIAVSTSGASPRVAAQIRSQLEASFGEEYEIYLDFLHAYRMKAQQIVKDTNKRRLLLRRVADLELQALIRNGEFEPVRDRLWAELEEQATTADGSIGDSII